MILETKTDTLIMEEGEVQDSTNMEIDKDSHAFLMRMLSKFYSDGIGSLIRETCSNALDSHRECNSTEPIIVSFGSGANGNYEFTVEDFGCGIDDQDVENIIKKYGKSTKRASANQLGAFGLGFKSPLAYTTSFYFIGRKNGIERKWMLYESDEEINKIDLLYEGVTTERNGVKIIVPVKWSDKNSFYDKIAEQLAYFENVFFNCGSIKNENVKIIRSEHFQWSSLVQTNMLHICLDNVYYPIDFNKLGISPINFPVGLRFTLSDGIFPVPNREQLKYTNEAKAVILEKIKQVADYFIAKYNESIKDTDDIFVIIKHHQTTSRNVPHLSGIGVMDVRVLAPHGTVKFQNPVLNGIKYLSINKLVAIKDTFLYPYNTKYAYQNGRFNGSKDSYRNKVYFSDIENQSNKVYIFTEMHMLKKIYLKEQIGNQYVKFVKKENYPTLGKKSLRYTGAGPSTYMNILELWQYPKSEWRDRIKEYQSLSAQIEKRFIDVDKITIPQSWYEARKKERLKAMAVKGTNKRRQKLSGEINAKVAQILERYVSGKNCKFVSTLIKMVDASKQKYFTLYGGTEDEHLMQKLFSIVNAANVKILMLSERELKNLEKVDLHNWMKISKFMEGKHRIFKRVVTAYLVNQLYQNFCNVFDRLAVLKNISTPLHNKVKELYDYKNKHYLGGSSELYESMLSVAEEHKLFDLSIYGTYKEVKYLFESLPFLNPLFGTIRYNTPDTGILEAIIDLFKYYKQKVDLQHYKLPINEPVTEEIEEEELLS